MDLFDQTTLECSKLITQRYSTSFTLGIKTLHKKLHFPIYAIYGFVRYADEIVDTFHDKDKARLLDEFEENTFKAIAQQVSLNPVLHAFQLIVNKYEIDHELIRSFLHSMRLDLSETVYNQDGYEEYIYGSAEVVGLMCLKVFCNGDNTQYEELLPPAKKLGAAFQKVNFIRDIKSDYEERGRVYFPGVDFNDFSLTAKEAIEADIQKDFDDALIGIKKLPKEARLGVYLAYKYYLKLFNKIKKCPPSRIKEERIRIPDARKFGILVGIYFKHRIHTI
ncbi:phytoene synthase [Roseivirga spongicola]|jgi:phytoene/squalene synthetase|uniref:Phytoene synthase n=1 Tax=Roseivirga spongicola TaxID=333140 RepID=A0A150XFS8_9BACT|nr:MULTISPECIES: phytoene/squalene synthase family protein [Roseivirga]KYG77581.1 phytoene synthase [Roseivirga spongicola]MBO6661621.1 phytoene/squalene synthase family protein [Roseivirga sp.]MBO6908394.1 phytoene/squalene synthase family protein [Roseivirga sp.]